MWNLLDRVTSCPLKLVLTAQSTVSVRRTIEHKTTPSSNIPVRGGRSHWVCIAWQFTLGMVWCDLFTNCPHLRPPAFIVYRGCPPRRVLQNLVCEWCSVLWGWGCGLQHNMITFPNMILHAWRPVNQCFQEIINTSPPELLPGPSTSPGVLHTDRQLSIPAFVRYKCF